MAAGKLVDIRNITLPGSYRNGDVNKSPGLSVDMLRYYEKIGLLPRIHCTAAGIRSYSDKDISRPNFVQRAQNGRQHLNLLFGYAAGT